MPNAYSISAACEAANSAEAAGIVEIGSMVGEIVRHHRDLGVSRALPKAADALGMGLRRARGYHHGEIRALPDGELDRCRALYDAYLGLRRAALLEEADVLGHRLAAARAA